MRAKTWRWNAGRAPSFVRMDPLRRFVLCVTLLLAGASPAQAQTGGSPASDPNLAHPTHVVKVQRDGYTIAGLVTHVQGATAFTHGIVLFPGYPGIMKLREENGEPRFELRGNFLVRSRRHWLDAETLVVVVDAPSDQWATFTQGFRESARYGADVASLLEETRRRFNVANWTFVGTSEGSVSAVHAARMNPLLARRTILTASLFRPTRNGPGLSGVNWAELPGELLWAHHEDDPCSYTSYRDARAFSQRSGKPLLTARGGGPGRGAACDAFTAHGFVGVEHDTVIAMRAWVKSGALPADAKP